MKNSRGSIPVSSIITAIVVLAGSLYFIKICVDGLNQGYVEEGWKTTQGIVIDPDLVLEGRLNKERVKDGLEQTINYEYSIDEITYQSNSVSREIFVDQSDFPQGKTITVYYNPANKEDSILVRTPVQAHYLYAMIVFCLIVIGVVVFSLIRDFRNSK